ncbi:PARP-1-like protein [Schizophyllum commune]
MPPRKKADSDAAPAVPTRQSSRIKAAAAAAPPPAPAPPVKKAPAKKAAAKKKEVADKEEEEEGEEEEETKPKARSRAGSRAGSKPPSTTKAKAPAKKPASKAAAKKTVEDVQEEDEEEEEPQPKSRSRAGSRAGSKPPSTTKPRATSKKPATKAAAKKTVDDIAEADEEDEDELEADADQETDAQPTGKRRSPKGYRARAKPNSDAKAKPKSDTKPKSTGKRARAVTPSDDEDEQQAKTASKKAKKAAAVDDDAMDEDDEPPAKMVSVLKRGAAPVDPESGKVSTHQVYANAEGVWDAMLNQTDIGANKNKFYVIQLLHPIDNESSCWLYTRWGRVGERGQSQLKGPWPPATAVSEFKKQFKAKAAVPWEQRVGMVAKKGKYFWLERDFGDEDKAEEPSKKGKGRKSEREATPIPDSSLDAEVQDLCRLIFNTALIDAHLSSMNYDANKLPLGKLSKNTILQGFSALKQLADVIKDPNGEVAKANGGQRAAIEHFSGVYYSIIPHAFGRNRPTPIGDERVLKAELDLVDALGDMEVASKLISSSTPRDESGAPMNPLDAKFRSLELTRIEPIARASAEFAALEAYVNNTHGATHHFRVGVRHIYRVERESETVAWKKAGFDRLGEGERMLLWHGSRTTNFAGILKQGLRIAPPEAPVTGYMFGKGVYFADMMSKSAGYCYMGLSGQTGLLLLCEVAVKPFYERYDAEYDADKGCKKANALATKGIGRTQPVNWKDAGEVLGNDALKGCHMPDGPCDNNADPKAYLQYNEYIVYNTAQIRARYLLMVDQK